MTRTKNRMTIIEPSNGFPLDHIMPHPDVSEKRYFHCNFPFLRSKRAICACCITTNTNCTFSSQNRKYCNENSAFPIRLNAPYYNVWCISLFICKLQICKLRVDSALRALSTLRGLRRAPEVLCRETFIIIYLINKL